MTHETCTVCGSTQREGTPCRCPYEDDGPTNDRTPHAVIGPILRRLQSWSDLMEDTAPGLPNDLQTRLYEARNEMRQARSALYPIHDASQELENLARKAKT